MKKTKILNINTEAEDFSNGRTMLSNNPNNSNSQINQKINNKKLTLSTLNMNSLSPTRKNFGTSLSIKTNKITELGKRHSSNTNGNNENRQSLWDNKFEAKSNLDKINVLVNVNEKFVGSLSPKISNGIGSKNSKMFKFNH